MGYRGCFDEGSFRILEKKEKGSKVIGLLAGLLNSH
jgi:hypothetical protein